MLISLSAILQFQSALHGMLSSKKLCTFSTRSTFPKKISTIAAYNAARDKESIAKIARENISRLISITTNLTPEEYDKLLHEDILAPLEDEDIIRKTFLCDDIPVGFINYSFYQPWYNKFSCNCSGLNAAIHHLAIASEHQNKGYGTLLLKDALEDCHNRSVHTIILSTTSDELEKYYRSFGFRMKRCSKYTGATDWEKRLEAHPFSQCIKALVNKFKKE